MTKQQGIVLIGTVETVLFVPGLGTNDASAYTQVTAVLEEKGYHVRFVAIDWHRTTITDWVRQVQEVYAEYDSNETILAGFSFGAMTALVVAAARNPAQLWLLSLSPYFAEDKPHLSQAMVDFVRENRLGALTEIRFADLVQHIASKTLLFFGSEESEILVNRARRAHRAIAGSRLIEVEGVKHNLTHPHYLRKLTDTL